MSPTNFLSQCPFVHIADIYRGKCSDLQRQDQVNHVFCLGGIVCIKLSENGSPVKLYHMNDMPGFPFESSI